MKSSNGEENFFPKTSNIDIAQLKFKIIGCTQLGFAEHKKGGIIFWQTSKI